MQIMVGAVAFVIMVSIYFIITRDELFEGIIDKIRKGVKNRKWLRFSKKTIMHFMGKIAKLGGGKEAHF